MSRLDERHREYSIEQGYQIYSIFKIPNSLRVNTQKFLYGYIQKRSLNRSVFHTAEKILFLPSPDIMKENQLGRILSSVKLTESNTSGAGQHIKHI